MDAAPAGTLEECAEALPLKYRLVPRFIRNFSPKHWANARAAGLARRLTMWAARDSNLVAYARRELNDPAGIDDPMGREMETAINAAILEIVAVHSNEGHSGASHGFALGRAKRLMDFKPLGPLTGEDDEWMLCGGGFAGEPREVYQNRRCFSVFKYVEPDGSFYCEHGEFFVFVEPDGCAFTSYYSRVRIGFPHAVKDPVYIDVPKDCSEEQKLEAVQAWYAENRPDGIALPPPPEA